MWVGLCCVLLVVYGCLCEIVVEVVGGKVVCDDCCE